MYQWSGFNNIAIGVGALSANTTGNHNIAIGVGAMAYDKNTC